MADTPPPNVAEGAPAGGRPGGWTDSERFQLVLRVLATVLTDGRGVEWKHVQMPGRTLKALQGQWTSIIAQMRDLNTEDGGDVPVPKAKTPRKKPVAKKAAAKSNENVEDSGEDQDDGETKKKVSPKKRTAANDADGTPKKRRAPAKKAAPKTELVSDEAGTEGAVPKEENTDEQ
ncbi:hypothetical protein LY76DRAFT_632593 [Colletotrichum caudatum]|nr:hypothetical protein LY76DRAFT_632593 [Colletotrichum caudatum]